MTRAVVFFNRYSGSGTSALRASQLTEHLRRSAAFEVKEVETDEPGKCFASACDFDLAIVVGGDGSLNAALQGANKVPIAFLAGGTANVASRVLGLPSDPAAFARALESAQTIEVPVAYADERRWLLFAEVGYQAQAVARVNAAQTGRATGPRALRRLRKQLAFAKAFLTELGRKGSELAVHVGQDGELLCGTNVLLYRTPCYGAWFQLPLEVDPTQPEFGVLVIRATSRFARLSILLLALFRLLRLMHNRLERAGLLAVRRASFVRVLASSPTACHIDAESLPFLPTVFRVSRSETIRLLHGRPSRL